MAYHYEAIRHQLDIPIKIFTHTVDQFPYHWHEDMEILFVLKGAMEIRVDQKSYQMGEGDLFLVNRSEVHIIKSNMDYGQTHLLALQFHPDYFMKFQLDMQGKLFRLNSADDVAVNQVVYQQLRFILASMMNLVLNQEPFYGLLLEKHLLEIAVLLLNHCEVKSVVHTDRAERSEGRLLEILKYINDHCIDPNLSLQQIADQFFLNPQYVSRYFKTHVGIPLKKFIDSMRMNRSLQALQLSDDRILDIALSFGFPDAKAYYRVFKEVLGMTPMAYREMHQLEFAKQRPKDYFSINSKESLGELYQYLIPKTVHEQAVHQRTPIAVSSQYDVDLHASRRSFEQITTPLLTFGYAPHGLRSDFAGQLKMIQEEIGFQYARFHGIFADELLVYNQKSDGQIYYNFNHIDVLLDNLLASGLKPFIELGFMPEDLASENATIFWWRSNISPPKSLDDWTALVSAFVRHVINRYGIEEVRSWYFEFWNEPDVDLFFWKGSREAFFEFYRVTYLCIKEIDEQLRVGGFGNLIFWNTEAWLRQFATFARDNDLKLDFFSFHIYNIQSPDDTLDEKMLDSLNASNREQVVFTDLADNYGVRMGHGEYITESIDKMLKLNRDLKLTTGECWITEWNANVDSRDLVHDTCYMAAFIVKNTLQNFEKVSGMGFWTFTDLFEEHRIEQPLFHGGFGLLTYNGIKKAGYHGYAFLSRLSGTCVHQAPNMVVTCDGTGENYQILLYNYCHTNSLYSTMDYSQITMVNRYDAFETGEAMNVSICLEGITGQYAVEQFSVNRDHGSSFDAWVRMGAPKLLTKAGLKHLEACAEPAYRVWEMQCDQEMTLETALEPHEIQLIILTKKY